MIRPLRSRHRWIVTLLAIIVPVLFVLGLMARRAVPADDTPVGDSAGIERDDREGGP